HSVRLLVVPHWVLHEKLQDYLGKQLQRLRVGMVAKMKLLEVRRLEVWSRNETSVMMAIARSRGGKLLSRSYVNDGTKLRWRCAEGHTWETTPNIIKHGGWCGVCGRRRVALKRRAHTSDEMRALAKKLRGVCLSGACRDGDRVV